MITTRGDAVGTAGIAAGTSAVMNSLMDQVTNGDFEAEIKENRAVVHDQTVCLFD